MTLGGHFCDIFIIYFSYIFLCFVSGKSCHVPPAVAIAPAALHVNCNRRSIAKSWTRTCGCRWPPRWGSRCSSHKSFQVWFAGNGGCMRVPMRGDASIQKRKSIRVLQLVEKGKTKRTRFRSSFHGSIRRFPSRVARVSVPWLGRHEAEGVGDDLLVLADEARAARQGAYSTVPGRKGRSGKGQRREKPGFPIRPQFCLLHKNAFAPPSSSSASSPCAALVADPPSRTSCPYTSFFLGNFQAPPAPDNASPFVAFRPRQVVSTHAHANTVLHA